MKKQNKYIIFILLILLLIIIFEGCIFSNDNKNNETNLEYKFEIKIIQESPTDYEIYLPIPIDEKNEIIEQVTSALSIKGEITYEIINTTYGKSIKINGIGDATLNSNGKLKNISEAWLSMVNDTNGNGIIDEYNNVNYFIFLNSSTNSKIQIIESFRFYNNIKEESYNSWINTELNNGWQLVEGKRDIEVK